MGLQVNPISGKKVEHANIEYRTDINPYSSRSQKFVYDFEIVHNILGLHGII